MRIFREGKRIRCQLQRQIVISGRNKTQMLFDFTVAEEEYEMLRQHMIKVLQESPLEKL